MTDFEELGLYGSSSKKSHPWGQIVISIAAVIVTFVGAKIEGYDWVLYLTIPLLLIAFVLMLSSTVLGTYLKSRYQSYKAKKVISKSSEEYIAFLEEFKLASEITDALLNLDWGAIKRPYYRYRSNRLAELKAIVKDKRHSKFSKTIYLNHALNSFVDELDSFMQECDYLVVQRQVKYKSEHDRTKMLRLIRKYDSFRERHDSFCKKINKVKLETHLYQFYEHIYSFVPKEIFPVTEAEM